MEDNITARKDEALLKGLKFEIEGADEKAIKEYQLAGKLGSAEANFNIARIYLRKSWLEKENKALGIQAYEQFCNLYRNAPMRSIDGLALLWLNNRNTILDTEILQFIANKANDGDKYAQEQFKKIKENLQ